MPQFASALNHPHVCVVYDVGETNDGLSFIALEFVKGQSLDVLIKKGPLEIARVVQIAIQVADALDAAHSRFNYDVPSELERITLKLLAKDAADGTSRPASCSLISRT